MLKSYHLHPEDLIKYGIQLTHSGSYRLHNTQEVGVPRAADVVIMPMQFRETTDLTPALLQRIIQNMALDERRVTCFDCSDFCADSSQTNPLCMFVRCNLKKWMSEKMPRSIPWFWPVENWSDIVAPPEGGFQYDVSAHMWLSSATRKQACESVKKVFGERADLRTRSEFYGYIERDQPERAKQLKADMKHSMRVSRLSLCPASIHGVFPYRWWEALSAGRVPVLFCSDYNLPWRNKVDYDACTIRFDARDAEKAGPLIQDWLAKHDDKQIVEMGLRGRQYWEEWFNRDKQESLFAIAIEERLTADGLL